MYTLGVMVHTEFFTGHIATISGRDLFKKGAVLAISASIIGAIATDQNHNINSGGSRSSEPVLTPTTLIEKSLTVEGVDLFNGGSLPEGMATSSRTPGTAEPQT